MEAKLTNILLLFLAALSVGRSQTTGSAWQWGVQFGEVEQDQPNQVVTAADGSIYVAGEYGSDQTPGGLREAPWSFRNALLAKFSATGELLWAKQLGGPGYDEARGVATDGQGNVYVAGRFEARAAFGAIDGEEVVLQARGNIDAFLAKYSAAGQLIWARQFGGASSEDVIGLSVEATGRAYVAGSFLEQITFDTLTLSGRGTSSGYLAAFTPEGKINWVQLQEADSWLRLDAFDSAPDGSLLVAARFADSLRLGPASPAVRGHAAYGHLLVVRYQPESGAPSWRSILPGSASGHVIGGLGMDPSGNIVVGGQFSGKFRTPYQEAESQGLEDVFVYKIRPNNTGAWLQTGGGPGVDQLNDLTIDGQGNIFATGTIAGRGGFGSLQLLAARLVAYNAYALRLTPAGNPSMLLETPSELSQVGQAIAINPQGQLLLAGSFVDNLILGDTQLRGAGLTDIFLTAYELDLVSGIDDPLQSDGLVVYPNPARGQVQLDLSRLAGRAAHVLLTNGSGQVLVSRPVAEQTMHLPLAVVPGLYALRVLDASGRPLAVSKLLVP